MRERKRERDESENQNAAAVVVVVVETFFEASQAFGTEIRLIVKSFSAKQLFLNLAFLTIELKVTMKMTILKMFIEG